MSIQDNTTALQEILETVNALPEAGSGRSGGASGETCSVTVHIDNPLAVKVGAYSSVLYLDKDGVATTITFTDVDINDEVLSVVVDALKNSMIVVYLNGISYGNTTGNSVIVSGGITEGIGLMGLSFYNGVAPFYITGDGTIDISLNE